MKITLFLAGESPLTTVEWDYPTTINAWVYKILNRADPVWGDQGHRTRGRAVRPFSISPLDFPVPAVVTPAGLVPQSGAAVLTIGTVDAALARALETYAADEILVFGDTGYRVDAVVVDPVKVEGDSVMGMLSSPIVIARRDAQGSRIFLPPRHPDFWVLVQQNLAHKARQFFDGDGNADDVTVATTGTWRRKMTRFDGHPVIGWITASPLTITGPRTVCEAALTFGLGAYNAHGFGTLRLVESSHDEEEWAAF